MPVNSFNGASPNGHAAPTSDIKQNLDIAWLKTQNGLKQENEGRLLWIEGTLELIKILDDARTHLGDQAFGAWLREVGYGEDRISRDDRSALLNMAKHPEVTLEVLGQTHRRSPQTIWREEIQPRLRSPTQPTDGAEPEAPASTTRRPKKKKPPKEPWVEDRKHFKADGLRIANEAIALKNTVEQCNAEQCRKLAEEADAHFLKQLEQAEEAFAYVRARLNGTLQEEANKLIRKGRIRSTPARASAPIRPSGGA